MNLALIAASLSIDAFSIGAAYGMRNIKIPLSAKLIISGLSFVLTTVSVFLGKWVSHFLSEAVSVFLGVAILVFIGVWIIMQSGGTGESSEKELPEPKTLLNIAIKSFGISIQIIRNPYLGDRNKSNVIEPVEAAYIGVALSIDSLGAGFACAVLGVGAFSIPIAVAVCQLLFLSLGSFIFCILRKRAKIDGRLINKISGLTLIFMGLIRALKYI